jgi:hypothetical protein
MTKVNSGSPEELGPPPPPPEASSLNKDLKDIIESGESKESDEELAVGIPQEPMIDNETPTSPDPPEDLPQQPMPEVLPQKPLFPIPASMLGDPEEGGLTPEEELVQLNCSEIGEQTARLLVKLNEFVLGPQSSFAPEDLQSIFVKLVDGKIEPASAEDLEDSAIHGSSTAELISVQYSKSQLFRASYSHPDKGSVSFGYKNLRDRYSTGNGWTVSSKELGADGTVALKVSSKDITPDEIKLANDVLKDFLSAAA